MATDNTGFFLIGAGAPLTPLDVPGILTLPELPAGSPATATAMLVALLVGEAIAVFIPKPPSPKKTRAEQDKEDGKQVIKVSEVHKALDATITGVALSALVGRILLTLLKPPHQSVWTDPSDFGAEASEIIKPLIDKVMIEVRKRALQQNNDRLNGLWLEGRAIRKQIGPGKETFTHQSGLGHSRLRLRLGPMHNVEGKTFDR